MSSWLWSIPPDNYPVYVKTGTFAVRKVGRRGWAKLKPGDTVFAYLSGRKVIAGMFEVVSKPFEDATPLVRKGHFPYRVRVRPLVTLSEEAWVSYEAFHDKLDVVQDYPDFRYVVQQVIHPLPTVDAKVLAFLVRAREASDLEQVLAAYDAYLKARDAAPSVQEAPAAYTAEPPFDRAAAVEALIGYIEARGYVYEPWQVAAYVTALRTKPFVILAGVTGTGKSRLPALVAAGTGGHARLVPVRPDWTDSAEVLGYTDLQGAFRPGAVLEAARAAQEAPARHVTCIVDEMNLARVEHYFAEVLSRIEDRRPGPEGGYATPPLLDAAGPGWASIGLPPNLGLVGTVNMDESAHGFSRKVLDRAFTIELATVDFTARPAAAVAVDPVFWPVAAWYPRAIRLAEIMPAGTEERACINRVVETLTAVNGFLMPAQLQVAYRTRDEVVLFLLHAAEAAHAFRSRDGTPRDPLDLAIQMKVLPRLLGGSRPLRRALLGLLGWAATGRGFDDEDDARALLDPWDRAGRPAYLADAPFPGTAARLCLMWDRLAAEGFTSFWV